MTSANLDLVRSVVDAWVGGDYSETEWADPEIALMIADGPAPGSWTGLAGMAEGWRAKAATLFHVRGGKVSRLVVYFDREHALADLGLAPGASSARP